MLAKVKTGSVLLVEDEDLISLDLCDCLVEAGYRIIGPATCVAVATFWLGRELPQVAILDVLLRDGSCTGLARQLRGRSIPFLIHSRYGRHATSFADAPWLTRPAPTDEIAEALNDLSRPSP